MPKTNGRNVGLQHLLEILQKLSIEIIWCFCRGLTGYLGININLQSIPAFARGGRSVIGTARSRDHRTFVRTLLIFISSALLEVLVAIRRSRKSTRVLRTLTYNYNFETHIFTRNVMAVQRVRYCAVITISTSARSSKRGHRDSAELAAAAAAGA